MAQAVQRLAIKLPQMAKSGAEFATPRLQTFWKYARVELKPPGPSEFPQVAQGFTDIMTAARTGKWKTLTVKQAWLNTLIGVEIGCWFFVGECIGKGSVIGYKIPGAMHFDAGF